MSNQTRQNLATAWAPAKVNLYLHVGPPGPGGLHPVDSLVMFADTRAADRVSARMQAQLELAIEGPAAKALRGAPNNLTLAAAKSLRDACDRIGLGAHLTLHKVLPVAGGIGGGSSDAAATLQVLNKMWDINFGDEAIEKLAEQLGSDVPACVRQRPLVMRGTGEQLFDADAPDLPVVLVNPGAQIETRKAFEKFDQTSDVRSFSYIDPPESGSPAKFAAALASCRNDLEPVASQMCPDIPKVLAALKGERDCLLARMSGSGATCFGIFASEEAAQAAAESISTRRKKFWVKATTLRGSGHAPYGRLN